ncbi:MAG: response regulator [Bacteroidetes bacterium]|nr:response regulator [Bacteroidota bacterium]
MINNSEFKILVVDDEPDQLKITEHLLRKEHYAVKTAQNGMECLHTIRMDKPDLLMLDVVMPDMSGIDICMIIKSDPALSSVYIILLSGLKIQTDQIAEGLETGADGYIIKPYKRRELLARIEAAHRTISAEKKLRILQTRTDVILSEMPDIIMEVNRNKVYTWANHAGYQFFGDDVIGKEAAFYFEEDQKTYEIVDPLFYGADDIFYVESWQKRKDGEKRLLAWRCRVLKDENGKVVGALSSARDITQAKQAELAMMESEERFRSLVKLAPIPLCFVNREGVLSYFNDRFIRTFGYTSADIPTLREWWKLAYPDEGYRRWVVETWEKAVAKAAREGIDIEPVEYNVTCKNGIVRVMEISGITIGENFLASFIDLTGHKKAEYALRENEHMLRESQEVARLGSYIWDLSEDLWTSSKILDDIFGIDEKYIRSLKGWTALIHPDWQDTMHNYVVDEILGKLKRFDKEYKIINKKNGKEYWVHGLGRLELDQDNKPLKLIGTITDISKRKQVEVELLKAKNKAEESDRLKSVFLANMSHEIRTPMNAIVGFAGMLSDPELSEDDRNRFSGIIQSRSDDLMHIINDLLEISRIESGNATFVKQKVFLNSVLDEMEEVFRQKLERSNKTNIRLVAEKAMFDTDSNIVTDGLILRQVLSNLIDNAVKYTESGSVRFGYNTPVNGTITFYVADTGIGISQENHHVIFEHFRQAESQDQQKYGGTGLGLSICKGSLALLGGEIWVESSPGNGSTFFFRLPFEPDKEKNQSTGSVLDKQTVRATYNWSGKKILLVEDEQTNMDFLQIILGRTNAELIPIYNGSQLKAMYDNLDSFDLVLLDIRLPDANGWDLAKEIKSIRPGLKIVAQTAYAMSTDRKKSEEAGCDGYISKPIRKNELYQILDKFMLRS